MSNRVILFVAPLLGVLCLTTSSRAGMITWMADWSQSSNTADSNGGPQTGGISLASPPIGVVQTGNQTITAATLTTFTSAQPGNPDQFNAVPYTLKVELDDVVSNQLSTLTFTGSFSGTLSTTTAALTNTFNSPVTQAVQIGGNLYTVTLTSFLAPGPTTPANGASPVQGYIKAQVVVYPVEPVISSAPVSTPEPGSLVLAGLGTSLFGMLRFRRRS